MEEKMKDAHGRVVRNLYHGTSLQSYLQMIVDYEKNGIITSKLGFYLDVLITDNKAKEFYESIKGWPLAKFVDTYKGPLNFTQSFSVAASYALQNTFPLVISIDADSVKAEDSQLLAYDRLGHIHEIALSFIDVLPQIKCPSYLDKRTRDRLTENFGENAIENLEWIADKANEITLSLLRL